MKHARKDYDQIQDPSGKIPEDEPVFLLRAQDKTAVQTLMVWISLNEMLPDHDPAIIETAKRHLKSMKDWPKKKTADL